MPFFHFHVVHPGGRGSLVVVAIAVAVAVVWYLIGRTKPPSSPQ